MVPEGLIPRLKHSPFIFILSIFYPIYHTGAYLYKIHPKLVFSPRLVSRRGSTGISVKILKLLVFCPSEESKCL